jgi:hypothetical protein
VSLLSEVSQFVGLERLISPGESEEIFIDQLGFGSFGREVSWDGSV